MSAATPVGLPSRVAVRWYQLAVLVLGVALAAMTALAVYFAVTNPTAVAIPAPGPGRGSSQTVAEQPCYQPQIPC
jgi:hypothetical protein